YHVTWGDTVTIGWNVTPSGNYCTAGASWHIDVSADGLIQYSGQNTHGSVDLTPVQTASLVLTIATPVTSKTLGGGSTLTVDPYDPQPLPASQRPLITLPDDSTTSRKLFVQAVRTQGEVVIIAHDLDLSGLDHTRIAQGVHIVGMPVAHASGPRLHTRTFPDVLLSITGGHAGDAA